MRMNTEKAAFRLVNPRMFGRANYHEVSNRVVQFVHIFIHHRELQVNTLRKIA